MLAAVASIEAEVEELTVVDTFTVVVSETAVVDGGFLVEMSFDGSLVGAEEEEVIVVDTSEVVVS